MESRFDVLSAGLQVRILCRAQDASDKVQRHLVLSFSFLLIVLLFLLGMLLDLGAKESRVPIVLIRIGGHSSSQDGHSKIGKITFRTEAV